MLVMVLERISPRTARPLEARKVPDPVPGQGELLLRVLACAVCRTDLHLVDGELDPRVPLPRIPGHQVVGTVAATGPGCVGFSAGALVSEALAAVERGATVVCAGIHMGDIPAFPYATLWHERELCSVANLTHADGAAFLARAAELSLTAAAERFPLDEANSALHAVRSGALSGSAVLVSAA